MMILLARIFFCRASTSILVCSFNPLAVDGVKQSGQIIFRNTVRSSFVTDPIVTSFNMVKAAGLPSLESELVCALLSGFDVVVVEEIMGYRNDIRGSVLFGG
jgi:hypothetical protein